MTHTLRYAARTDRGLLRANNQDSVFAGNRLLVVADGMGGHVAGDTASKLAVAAFAPLDDYDPSGRDLLTPLEHATEDGNEAIADMVLEDPDLDGMGTTVTALLFDGSRLGIAHVGDSRAYLWRGGVLSQITHDDTFVQSLIDEGRITEKEASQHPQRSLLLRALNGASDVEPTLSLREARVGDRYLICSDGLSGVISAEAIADTLASYETAEAADRLIELALRGGGPDNVTVIVADVLDTGELAALDSEPLHNFDSDATGPLDQLRFTKRMPRVPLPKEPDVAELAARAEAQRALEPATTPIRLPGSLAGTGASVRSGRSRNDLDEDIDEDIDDDLDDDLDSGDSELDGADYPSDDLDDLDTGVTVAASISPARRWARRIGYALGVVLLLIIGGVLGVNWVGNQYYVSDNAGAVTVFRGVDGSILGLELSSAQEGSCWGQVATCVPLQTGDLVPSARDQVLAGIPATDLQNAREIVSRLADQLLPLCSELASTTLPTAPSSASQTSTSTSTMLSQAPPASATTGAATSSAGTGSAAISSAATSSAATSTDAAAAVVTSTATVTVTTTAIPTTAPTAAPGDVNLPSATLSADAPVPGVNCRTGA